MLGFGAQVDRQPELTLPLNPTYKKSGAVDTAHKNNTPILIVLGIGGGGEYLLIDLSKKIMVS